MDLVAMAQTVARYKLVTAPVILLVAVLGIYVMFVSTPDFQAQGSYILVSPPAPPSQSQIASDPALANVNANNPLMAYGDLSVVGLMVTQRMSTPATQQSLVSAGVDPRSAVGNDTIVGNAPLIDVTGVGSSAAAAIKAGKILGRVLLQDLNQMQAQLGVNPTYRIKAYPVTVADRASQKVSSKLRNLIVVIVIGIILLFVAVSSAKAWEERKQERAAAEFRFSSLEEPDTRDMDGAAMESRNGHGAHVLSLGSGQDERERG